MDFRTGINIQLMTSKALRGKAPQGFNWGEFYKTFKQQTITPHGFAAHIYNGYPFIPPYSNGRRLEENYTTAYHVAFDFDSEGSSLDHLMQDKGIADQFASFAYSTPSSTPEQPKSRVVFIIPEGIDSSVKMRQLYAAIASRFKEEGSITDPSCKDPLRLYYGSYRCEVRPNWSALFPSAVNDLIDFAPKPEQQKEYTIVGGTVALSDASELEITNRIQYELGKVSSAPKGQRHETRCRIAYLFGGFVGAGHLTSGEACDMLGNATRAAVGFDNNKTAFRTIENAVKDGMSSPVIIQVRTKQDITL